MNQQKILRVIIADDENLARAKITNYLKEEEDIRIIAECADGKEAVLAINEHQPDLIFLDIQMPIMNGFEVLEMLKPESIPVVVFTTAYDQYAIKAFDYHAIDYLLKPYTKERFLKTLDKAREKIKEKKTNELLESLQHILSDLKKETEYVKRLVVKDDDCYALLSMDEIYWIDSSGNYIDIHTHTKSYQVRKTLSVMERQLDPRFFLRISRFSIVNINNIKEVQEMFKGNMLIIMKNNKRLTLGRRQRKRFKEIMNMT